MIPHRTRFTNLALALCLTSILSLSWTSSPAEAQTSAQTVYGTVMDESGTPLTEVTIRIKTLVGSPIVLKSKTTKKGKYRLVLPIFKYDFDVTVEKEGYHTYFETIDFVMLRNGERSAVRNFTLLTPEGAARRALHQARAGQVMDGIQEEAVAAFNRGAQHYNASEMEAAQAELEAALTADPAIGPARRLLAQVHFRLESYAAAAEAAQAIVELTGDDREMWEILLDSARKTGNEEGMKKAKAALEALPR